MQIGRGFIKEMMVTHIKVNKIRNIFYPEIKMINSSKQNKFYFLELKLINENGYNSSTLNLAGSRKQNFLILLFSNLTKI